MSKKRISAKGTTKKKANSRTSQSEHARSGGKPKRSGKTSASIVSKKSTKVKSVASYAEGTVGSVLTAKDPHAALEACTPQWIKDLKTAESENFDRVCYERYLAQKVMKRISDDLMQLADINGVHVGYRRRENKIDVKNLELCIRVHVPVKFPNHYDSRITTPLPQSIEGVSVDVLERTYRILGDPTFLTHSRPAAVVETTSSTIPPPREEYNPLRGGIAIANELSPSNWGTLGLPVTRNGKRYLITNAHVASSLSTSFPQKILQPPLPGARAIGQVHQSPGSLSDSVTPSSDRPRPIRDENMDAAVLLLENANSRCQFLGPGANGLFGHVPQPGFPRVGQKVFIIGAASGLLGGFGLIRDIAATVNIERFGTMRNQILADPVVPGIPISIPGDSGALLLSLSETAKNTIDVVGLVFAKSDDGTLVATPIGTILDYFQIRFV